MLDASAAKIRVVDAIGQIDRDAWNALFPGEPEDHDYLAGCRQGPGSRPAGTCRLSTGLSGLALHRDRPDRLGGRAVPGSA
jgi:hypothetical protein